MTITFRIMPDGGVTVTDEWPARAELSVELLEHASATYLRRVGDQVCFCVRNGQATYGFSKRTPREAFSFSAIFQIRHTARQVIDVRAGWKRGGRDRERTHSGRRLAR